MTPKTCKECGVVLEIPKTFTEAMRKARRTRCKTCQASYQKAFSEAYRKANRAKAIEDERRWREANPEKYHAKLEKAKSGRRPIP